VIQQAESGFTAKGAKGRRELGQAGRADIRSWSFFRARPVLLPCWNVLDCNCTRANKKIPYGE